VLPIMIFFDFFCLYYLQASKKAASKRGKVAQRGSSNVFSMFEQSQIQEFKEVSLYIKWKPNWTKHYMDVYSTTIT